MELRERFKALASANDVLAAEYFDRRDSVNGTFHRNRARVFRDFAINPALVLNPEYDHILKDTFHSAVDNVRDSVRAYLKGVEQ